MAKIGLQSVGIDAFIGQRVPADTPKHAAVDRESRPDALAQTRNQRVKAFRSDHKRSGGNLLLDCTNDRREYGTASTTSDHL